MSHIETEEHRLNTYLCLFDGDERRVEAMRPQSAGRKAFRAPHGYHWEHTFSKERVDMIVVDAEGVQTYYRLEENE